MTIPESGLGHSGDLKFLKESSQKLPFGCELGTSIAIHSPRIFLTFGQSEEF